MSSQPDYSVLDEPLILSFVFYPRQDWTPPPSGATDHFVTVEAGMFLSCRFYPCSPSSPSILFFHGNGEMACDYDLIAPTYNSMGINLFVADYRGYGMSGGKPTFAKMMSDAVAIFNYFCDILRKGHYNEDLFLMGRSLGSYSTALLASQYHQRIKGLILESGFANITRLLGYLGFLPLESSRFRDLELAHLEKIRSITMPVLIIHGDYDTLIPPAEALYFYNNVGAKDKRLVTIPKAGHNDIMLVGMKQYFSAIKDFVSDHKSPPDV